MAIRIAVRIAWFHPHRLIVHLAELSQQAGPHHELGHWARRIAMRQQFVAAKCHGNVLVEQFETHIGSLVLPPIALHEDVFNSLLAETTTALGGTFGGARLGLRTNA